MLKTGDGVPGQEEVYLDPCAFVYYVVNPWRSSPSTGFIGWFRFTITYTFSGLKRPGLTQRDLECEHSLTADAEKKAKVEKWKNS